jgi:hypothetical protein
MTVTHAYNTPTNDTRPEGWQYSCICTFMEKDTPKGAGFRYDGERKQWWTAHWEIAETLRRFMDVTALDALIRDGGDAVKPVAVASTTVQHSLLPTSEAEIEPEKSAYGASSAYGTDASLEPEKSAYGNSKPDPFAEPDDKPKPVARVYQKPDVPIAADWMRLERISRVLYTTQDGREVWLQAERIADGGWTVAWAEDGVPRCVDVCVGELWEAIGRAVA